MAKVENDLARLKGIGPAYADMLKSVGVDSIKELRHRKPENLMQAITAKHGRVVGLSTKTCASWIDQAKTYRG